MNWQLSILLLLCMLSGCGKGDKIPMGTVEGSVTINGAAPSHSLMITFVDSMNGRVGNGMVNTAGHYKISQPLPVGDYVVFFEHPLTLGANGLPSQQKAPKLTFDAAYMQEAKSPLSFAVKKGKNKIPIDLQEKISR